MNNIDFVLGWLKHYEFEFNESPHLEINLLLTYLRKHLTGFEFVDNWRE